MSCAKNINVIVGIGAVVGAVVIASSWLGTTEAEAVSPFASALYQPLAVSGEGACCLDDGTCIQATQEECAERQGRYQGNDTECRLVRCAPLGACCQLNGECAQLTRRDCVDRNGRYQGNGIDCDDVDCAGSGACCRGSECSVEMRVDCTRCARMSRCRGDIDGCGNVNPVDSGLCQAAFGSQHLDDLCKCDMDCDGQINPVDTGIIQSLFGTCVPHEQDCPGFGLYQGDNTDCEDNPCEP